ncbi:MAG TPA: alpha/beta fold hydrolase [Dehalococcoidia bacterium]|nr:alpha/beta fold hydrolase [Dehalococcoidia bacterium]
MPVVELNGIHINYEEHGDPNGAPILLTHAYAATLQMWAPQFEGLPEYRVIAWDIRGHGGTDSPPRQEDYTEKLTVADMAALLRHLGIEKAVIGGLSLGGYISLEFQVAHPEMVRALILCNTGPGYRKDDARAGWNEFSIGYAKRFEERGLEGFGRGIEIDATKQYQRSAQGLAFAGRGILTQRDAKVMDNIDKIAVPTLVVWGADDERYKSGCEYIAAKVPGAQLAVVAGAGHAVNLYQPEEFNRIVREFLRAHGI